MKEYRKINDLPYDLKKEIEDNNSFFNDFDGKSLDEQQRIACVLNDCDLEIIAGAGTGKTQTLVAKSSYLIEKKGIDPSEILCLSFSNSSVKDLSERLKYPIETRTIHAFGLSIIRKYETKAVLDENEFKSIFMEYLNEASEKELENIREYCEDYLANFRVKSRLKELDYEEEKFNYLIKNTNIHYKIQHFIDLFKGKDYDISDLNILKKTCEKDFDENFNFNALKNIYFLRIVEPVFRFYESFLFKNRLIDFNDMINNAIKIIEKEGISKNYKYIFVDEYQDMSYKNFLLVKAIKNNINANLVVVGDDWQSIYGFRDSDLKLFTDFDEYFPDAKRVFIEKTYRNSQQLIDTAGKFIMKNDNQFVKSLKSDLSIDKPIKIIYHSQKSEKENNTIFNLISNLSQDNNLLILGRHRKDIDEFLANTNLVKKGRTKNYKKITDESETIENVEFRTIHKAKGLEADYTIIIRVIDELVGFPNKLKPDYFMSLLHDWDYEDKLDEERRLFYVALTRAKKGVYIFTKELEESPYITELKKDNLNNLDIIFSDDKSTYSHLKEFNKAEKKNITEFNSIQLTNIDNADNDGITVKANLKEMGNKLIKSKDYNNAEDFYKKLLTNMYFLNDYYPYRKLVEVYIKKRESSKVIKTIEKFLKSETYCNNSQILWFKLNFKKACRYTNTKFSKFDEYLGYFNKHGLNNKDKQNTPVPIAARIQIKGKHVMVIPQEEFDKKSEIKELELNYKFARKYESSEKALYYFEQLWQQEGFNKNLTAYKRLCSFYNDTGQYEKVIEVANEYFESDAKRTKTSPLWFRKKIERAEYMLSRDFGKGNNFNLIFSKNEDSLSDEENLNDDIEHSNNDLTFDEKVDLKIDLYFEGKELLKNDNDKAIEFYKDLINHELFINDYHPFLKLSQAYHKNEDYENEIKTIENFFKSGRYCRNSTLNWFKKKLKNLDDLGYYNYSQINQLEREYKKYGAKNRKLTKIPVPLAGDIKSKRKNLNKTSVNINFNIYDEDIEVPDNLSYDEKIDFKYNLILKGKRLMENKYYDNAIVFYTSLLDHELFINDYHPHYKLSKCYGKTNRYNKQIESISNFFKSGIYAPDKIYKTFKRTLKGLNTHGYYDYSLFNKLEMQYLRNGALNSHLSDEPVLRAIKIIKSKENNDLNSSSNELKNDLNKNNDFIIKNSNNYSKDYFNKLAKDIQSNPDFVSDREISQHYEYDFIEIIENYDKINEKADLKNKGKTLEKMNKYEAIKFYDSLKTNSLFIHDYYPYRRQCILFKNKINDYQKDLDTIIELFNHEIYCNPHQYIWLYNKLLELIDILNLSEDEIHEIDNLLKNYEKNENKYFELQNTPVPIAERIFKDETGLKLLAPEKYDFVQDVYYIIELGVGYIRREEYETAISYYLNLLQSDILFYKYHAYKQLGRIYEEMNNPNEFKRLYEKIQDK